MQNHKQKKLIVIVSSIFFISILTIIIFFTDYIFNINSKISKSTQPVIFIKWLIIGYLINILILVSVILGKNYFNNIKGDKGMIGDDGDKGLIGQPDFICLDNNNNNNNNNNDNNNNNNFSYTIDKKFNKYSWKK